MGLTIRASVVIGFEVNIRHEYSDVKKFNEDTGEPYFVKEKSHQVAWCDGKALVDDIGNPDRFYSGEKIDELELFTTGDGSSRTVYLGVKVASLKDEPSAVSLVPDIPPAVVAFAEKHRLVAKQWLILYMN